MRDWAVTFAALIAVILLAGGACLLLGLSVYIGVGVAVVGFVVIEVKRRRSAASRGRQRDE